MPEPVARTAKPINVLLSRRLGSWDADLYLDLANRGYRKGAVTSAFYPLWPLVIRATAPLFGGSRLIAGLVLSNLFSLAAWVLFHGLAKRRWGEQAALWALVFLIAFPGSLFYQFMYTESLFLLLVMGLWLALENRRYGLAAVCAGLLPICRGIGAFVVLPLAWHAFRGAPAHWARWVRASSARLWGRWKASWRPKTGGTQARQARPVGEPGLQGRAWWVPWLLLGMPVVGWGFYLVLMWHWTGNPFEGFEAQKHWAVHSVHNLWDVPKFVIGFFNPTQWHGFTGSLLDRCVFVLLLYTLPVLWRLDKGLLVWTYVLGILPAMSGTFTSFTRYASCAFPMFIALGVVLSRREWRGLRYALLVVFVVLHLVLVWRFVNFRWAG